jgi:hypothetical protein
MKSGMLAAEAIYDLMQVYNDVETPEGNVYETYCPCTALVHRIIYGL